MTTTTYNPLKVIFVIDRMELGGMELQVIELLKGIDKLRFECTLIMFRVGGGVSRKLYTIPGVRVICLFEHGKPNIIRIFHRLCLTLLRIETDIVYSYLLGVNELCLLAGIILNINVMWGVRVSNLDFSDFGFRYRIIFRMGACLSRFARKVIFNSEAGKAYHTLQGYSASNMMVIPNGIDTDGFGPDHRIAHNVRNGWMTDHTQYLIGLVGRIHPMKDHPTFLKAAALLLQKRKDVRFVCVGVGNDRYLAKLKELEQMLKISDHLEWTGSRDDMTAVYNSLDILSLCSAYGEGFPNVVGEAMACGVPCVVTDVGDSARIVENSGLVVAPGSPEALVEAWHTILELPDWQYKRMKKIAREKIVKEFSLQFMVQRTENTLLAAGFDQTPPKNIAML
ncbi:MAG: glycosyltransferase [Desulfobacterales bacterium]|jgi:glycosyltransferase involved in cell wall biosynthesis|nr:glycosyltransferase [Desulfobacterales bacterium]MDP6806685.1 glycosyltransferase [Desulfobacterales bacterium]|tara:strand:+ start:20535 stop:21719 length:1185 start_codon:yes stop_codon:yes gene_type:complete